MSQLDFGIIGNCQVSALIDPRGAVVWCCMPRLDSSAIFASLLDAKAGGSWSIEPADLAQKPENWQFQQYYSRNTNVLVTVARGTNGDQFEIIDFMPRFENNLRMVRPPQLIRVVRPLKGIPKITVRCRPKFSYGKEEARAVPLGSVVLYEGRDEALFLSTDAPVSYVLQETSFELKESKHFVLSYGMPFEGPLRFSVEEQLERTIDYWRMWAKHCSIPFEFQNEVLRSALVLKLHIFEDTGAIIAAATTSLPEGPETGRTWDYRYCWLRDASFVISALKRLGQFEEMEAFIRYLQNIAASEASRFLQPVYGIGGERELVERELPWLSGFKGHGPVRVGNAAYKMDQHDVYGEMVLAIAPTFFDRRMDRTDADQAFRSVQQLVEQAILCFEQPDAGIWEFRGTKQHSVFSKVMNWAAVDRGAKIAAQIGRTELASEWATIRDRMAKVIQDSAWNDVVGYFTQSFGGDSPDAANLLLPAVNLIRYDDPKFQKTVDFYERSLRVGTGVFRYRTPDDFGVPKTTFTVCSFWMVDALWGGGRRQEARELFQSLVRRANPLGLLSEDMDPESGELWGNFPQTYSHVGLINSAMRISRSWDDEF